MMSAVIIYLAVSIIVLIVIVTINYIRNSKIKSIKGKHVVITGGSSGIGKGVAVEAAKLGAHVTILARDLNKLKTAEKEIIDACLDPLTQKVQSISLDVTVYENVEKELRKLDVENPIYMLINCAGMAICGKIEDIAIEDIKKLVELNFLGTVYTVKALVSAMKARNEGVIVLTASQAALLGIFGLATYSATKYALRGFAESLEMEVRPYNISVTLAMPPDTNTPGFENENKSKPKETQMISQTGGLFEPDFVAHAIMEDALMGRFYSYVGFESLMLSTLCCGMSPFATYLEVIMQSLVLGPFRLISAFYIVQFQKIIRNCKTKTE